MVHPGRRGSTAAVIAAVVIAVGIFAAGGSASAAAGGNFVLGQNNDAQANESQLHSTVTGDKATLVLYNDSNVASTGLHDTLRVFSSPSSFGAGVDVFAGSSTFSTTTVANTGVRSRATGIAVEADAIGSGAKAIVATGPSTFNGAVSFSSAGVVTIATGAKSVVVTPSVTLSASSVVLATLQSSGGTLKFVKVNAGAGTFTVRLTAKAKSSVIVAWFVIS